MSRLAVRLARPGFFGGREVVCASRTGARVLDSGFFGAYHPCTATLEAAGKPFKVRLPRKEPLVTGAELSLRVDPADLVLLTR